MNSAQQKAYELKCEKGKLEWARERKNLNESGQQALATSQQLRQSLETAEASVLAEKEAAATLQADVATLKESLMSAQLATSAADSHKILADALEQVVLQLCGMPSTEEGVCCLEMQLH
eukprot:3518163-Rhodomonas_salina.2